MISWFAFAGICLALLFFVLGVALAAFVWCDGFDMQETMDKSLKRAIRALAGDKP